MIDGELSAVVAIGKKMLELISLKKETSSNRFKTKTKHKKIKKIRKIFLRKR
tara:strand:- start:187 stop:342 length:156 start_codon:yes stop_codon:yes gene_type:complete